MRVLFRTALRHAVVTIGVAAAVLTAPATPGWASVPGPTDVISVSPSAGEVVGVAMPITVKFGAPVTDRTAAQQTLGISASHVPAGKFEWPDESTMRWTPSTYWPSHSTIAVKAGGMKYTFRTGSEVLGVASISKHNFVVSIDGVVQRTMPASMGKPKHPTPVGSFTALEKQNPVVMDSRTIGIPLNDPEGYKLTVNYAVRVTWGGVYVHSAPWWTGAQGNSNVSHGCINLSPDNAAWYYNNVEVGDPIEINA